MALKDLLNIVGRGTEASASYAFWVAETCGATLTASALVIEPDVPLHVSLELPQTWLDRIRDEASQEAASVLQGVAETAKFRGLSVETLAWKTSTGDADRDAGRLARYYDLTILRQPDPDGVDTSSTIESVLFESGRPVLIVPYIAVRPQLNTVLIAWDAGPTVARAVGDALPLLALAGTVEILTVDKNETEFRRRSSEKLVQHLKRHAIGAEAKHIASDMDLASTLLSYAADVDADLLVMGAYGHSRLREIILGGTTHNVLHSMTLPVMMAH
jgi:nucleotide-binding universal stress UspA family protein